MKIIKVGSDFSGVGAFDYAMKRISEAKGFQVENVFACDMDKFARISYLANHEEPGYYPMNVYDREIPKEPLDVYISSFPCQSFSLAGKRQGKDDEKGRGILFFNSLEFIQKNKPRYFIFENVKGLLSDDSGKTFNQIVSLSGGKSINGTSTFFPHEDSVPYHVHYAVLNAKHYGIPQNRERVFIIGIRDDVDNNFTFPAEVPLEKRLKDILEENVDEKYFLSEKMVSFFIKNSNDNKLKGNVFRFKPKKDEDLIENSITTLSGSRMDDNYIEVGKWNDFKDKNGNVKGFEPLQDNVAPTLLSRAREDGSGQPVIKIHSNTSKGFEEVTNEDSINFSNPHSKTRRGRVGKGVAQTLDTQCNQGVLVGKLSRTENAKKERREKGTNNFQDKQLDFKETDISNTITTSLTMDHSLIDNYSIRRLTELECFRLMDFPDSHVANCKKEGISNSQLYKQAGNSIVVKCLELIINNLKLV